MLYLYGLIEKRPIPECSGVGGRPLARVDGGRLAAVVSEVGERPQATEDALWEHESVLEALMADGPVLPVRFGVVFGDATDVELELEARDGTFATALETVRGKVEIGLRVLKTPTFRPSPSTAAADDGAGPGRRYLGDRLARRQEARDLARTIQGALASSAVAARTRLLPEPNTLLSASYLVAVAQVEAFRAQVADLQRTQADVSLVCTGPWPPYNFVEHDRTTA